MPDASLLLPIVAFASSLIAWRLARRGRRVDDHPVCRKCGFDLFGKPADSTRCPECGRDVGRPRGVRIGNRRASRSAVSVVTACTLAAGAWLAVNGYRTAVAVDWDQHKPVWWLLREVAGSNAAASNAALAELIRRVESGSVGREVTDPLVGIALAKQSDRAATWQPMLGDLVWAAHDKGLLADGQWEQYAVNAYDLRLDLRPVVGRGQPIRIGFAEATLARCGKKKPSVLWAFDRVEWGGREIWARDGEPAWGSALTVNFDLLDYKPALAAALAALPDGRHEIRVRMRLAASATGGGWFAVSPKGHRLFDLTAANTLTSNVGSIYASADPAIDKSVRAAVRCNFARSRTKPNEYLISPGWDWGLPTDASFAVHVRRSDGWKRLGAFAAPAGKTVRQLMSFRDDGPPLTSLDVRLVSEPDAALETTDVLKIWKGEINLDAIPMGRTIFD